MNSEELVVLVDNNDKEIGLEEKISAHKKGLLHRAFSVFIFRKIENKLELLLQKRNKNKYHCGGLWTNTCCSHPRQQESVVDAGKRRLLEEMGISNIDLISFGNFIYKAEFDNGLIEHELDHVLVGIYNDNPININEYEVESYRWASIEQIIEEQNNIPEQYTPWFFKALTIIHERENLLQNIF